MRKRSTLCYAIFGIVLLTIVNPIGAVAEEPVIRVWGAVTAAVPIEKPNPELPASFAGAGIYESVAVDLWVDSRGAVTRVVMLKGGASLGRIVKDGFMKWRFRPALVGKTPVPSISREEIILKAHGAPD